ncbi:hypothetical protein [Sinorhizobium medicae]|uniref:hypothetical protein n=1 Tax=Sinorhizobium medicae TaxID=110321 RepID=UPI001296BEF1|nr:hypothetical protein [Sinorhizobium medicae]MQX47109.1 hypothetical protein [Sinorhizobium medicae]
MDKITIRIMRERYNAEIQHAERMIHFIEKSRFVIKDVTDTRSDEEIMEEQRQMHLRLIDNYTRYLSRLDERLA